MGGMYFDIVPSYCYQTPKKKQGFFTCKDRTSDFFSVQRLLVGGHKSELVWDLVMSSSRHDSENKHSKQEPNTQSNSTPKKTQPNKKQAPKHTKRKVSKDRASERDRPYRGKKTNKQKTNDSTLLRGPRTQQNQQRDEVETILEEKGRGVLVASYGAKCYPGSIVYLRVV